MSSIKRYMENEEQKGALREVLNILLKTEQISHAVSAGIARKIVADGNTEGLSAKQLKVFDDHIKPFIDVICEKDDCNNEINILNLREAYDNQNEFGGLYCVDCIINMGRLKNI